MRPLVSVISLVYNHVRYLEACLKGVQRQTGDFDLEHWIVDDASQDGTSAILAEYERQGQGRIQVIRHESNRGANAGMKEAYALCQGTYIALCEGDDFWTAPDKLQAQVSLMERRKDLGLCYHDTTLVYESKRQWPVVRPGFGPAVQSLDDLLQDNRMHTCSVMYRRVPGLAFPDWYTDFTIGDWPNHAFHAARGSIGYLPRAMAAYRLHDQGSWSALRAQARAEQLDGMLEQLDAHFLFRYSDRLAETRRRIREEVLAQAA